MPKEKEKLVQVGLDGLGRFSIGEESNALYFDDAKVQSAPPAMDEAKLRSEIEEIVRKFVNPRLDNIESQLNEIRRHLSSARQAVAQAAKATPTSPFGIKKVEFIMGEIRELHDHLISSGRERAVAAKAKSKQVRRSPYSKK